MKVLSGELKENPRELIKVLKMLKNQPGFGQSRLVKKESVNEASPTSRQIKAIQIAFDMAGNMTGAVKKIEKLKKGLSKDKKVAAALRLANESVNEELQNSQGEQTNFKKGDVVKDINPDCPHVGSEGEVTKVGKGTITFKVTNNGKNYQEGDELEKTVDQMVKLKESVNELSMAPFSSPEARLQINSDIKDMSNLLGKTSQQVIKIMMNGVKKGKYTAMDIARGIKEGPTKRTHFGEMTFIHSLWNKMREKFRRYSKDRKLS